MSKYDYLKAYDFLGYPMVDTRARFLVPTRFGDDVEIETTLTRSAARASIVHRLIKGGSACGRRLRDRVWVVRDPDDPGAHARPARSRPRCLRGLTACGTEKRPT